MEHRVELDGDPGVHSETGLQAPECFHRGRNFIAFGCRLKELIDSLWTAQKGATQGGTALSSPALPSSDFIFCCSIPLQTLALSCSLSGK